MSNRIHSSNSSKHDNSNSTTSSTSIVESKISITVWLSRIVLFIILLLFTMPLALLLTPWWIVIQVFERKCPKMMNGYYRIVTWPLKLSKNIRSYQENDHFIEQLKY